MVTEPRGSCTVGTGVGINVPLIVSVPLGVTLGKNTWCDSSSVASTVGVQLGEGGSDVRVALRHLRLDVEQVRAATARRGAAAHGDTEEDKVVVQDLGSSSGTRVNGKRITHPTPLTHKDRIEIGPYVLNVSLFSPEQIRRSEED